MKNGRITSLTAFNPRPYENLLSSVQKLQSKYPHRTVSIKELNKTGAGLVTAIIVINSH